MKRASMAVAFAFLFAAGATFAQFGGMGGGGMGGGGMGGGGMGGGPGSSSIRRAVQIEMEGGRKLSGHLALSQLMLVSELGQYAIEPERIKAIRFLKPMSETEPEDDDGGPVAKVGVGQPMMKVGAPNRNGMIVGNPSVRAKVILTTGEEIIGFFPYGAGFRIDLDYGWIMPSMEKLRTMTFGDVPHQAEVRRPEASRGEGSAPIEPQSFRLGKSLVVRSPSGDRIKLYNPETRQSLDLAGPGDGPLEVAPVYGQGFMALSIAGPKITRIAVGDSSTGWAVQDLRQPAAGRLTPIVGQGMAIYTAGRQVYAYGAVAHRWDVVELPEGLRATPVVGADTATISGRGHLYTFSGRSGRWEHIDLRAILDGAEALKK